MKTTITFIIASLLLINLNAQKDYDYPFNFFSKIESSNTFKLDNSLNVSSSLKVLITPQFGSLFSESFKYVKEINNLENFYNDFDLGLNLGFNYEILKQLALTSVWNIGLLKFNLIEKNNIESAIMKVGLRYNF